jgi:hypothetical protein
MYLLSRSLATLTKHTKPISHHKKTDVIKWNSGHNTIKICCKFEELNKHPAEYVFMATLTETLPTIMVTFDEQDVSRVYVIIQVASFHYTYRFLIAKRATKEVDTVICVVCISIRPAASPFPYILPQENLDGLR